ncbi:response regulator [Larkinella terrae]|nr:response regulator [Larkinella terrae]
MGQKPKILIADDNPEYRQLITYHLTRSGYEVLIARHGQQVLEWLGDEKLRPDLLVLDLLMPQLSGIEVLQHVKTLPYKLPVILVSGADWLIARQGISQSDPDAFLTKPFSMHQLVDTIQALLQQNSTEIRPHDKE